MSGWKWRQPAIARAPPSVGRSSIPRRAYPACFARLSNSDSCPPPSSLHAKSCCPPTNLGVSGTGDGTRFGDSEQCKSAQSVAPWLFANRAFRAIFLACWKQILGLQPTLRRRHHSISRALKIHCGIEPHRASKVRKAIESRYKVRVIKRIDPHNTDACCFVRGFLENNHPPSSVALPIIFLPRARHIVPDYVVGG